MKVYCGKCKWYYSNSYIYAEFCQYKNDLENYIIDDYYSIKTVKTCFKVPKQKNKNNNCPNYSPKLWVKIKEWFKRRKK